MVFGIELRTQKYTLDRKRKTKRSDSVKRQKPLNQLKIKHLSQVTSEKKRNKNINNATIADRLRTFSLSNQSNLTGVAKQNRGSTKGYSREKGRDLT